MVLVLNGTFDSGSTDPWWSSDDKTTMRVASGKLCMDVVGGTVNPWDAQIGQSKILLKNGSSYTLSFDASASRDVRARTTAQLDDSPYTISAIVSPDAQVANALTPHHRHPVGAWLAPADNITGGPMPGHHTSGSRTTPPSAPSRRRGQGMRR